jgi:probable phosphoglycerate mutase
VATTRLVFVRHGHAQAAVDNVVAGARGCRGLSEAGVRQAEALRDRLRATNELRADVLLTSTLPRAIETADVIAPALGASSRDADCDLCELHPGECDGMEWERFRARYGFDMEAEPERPLSPGGESLRAFQARITRALAGIIERFAGQSVVIVSHGGFVSGACHALLGAPGHGEARPFRLEPENTSLTEWHRHDDSRWVLDRYNDAAHLLAP